MKNLKYFILLFVTALLIIPTSVFAEEENASEEVSKEVKIYFFRGDGCPHCQDAEEWFKSIEEEHGSKFEIVDYETWNNKDNNELMTKVAKARGEEESATGVPYIIVGDQSWIGFDTSYESEILEKINSMYEQEPNERYDIMELLDTLLAEIEEKEPKASLVGDIITLVLILVICGATGFGIYYLRNNNKKLTEK